MRLNRACEQHLILPGVTPDAMDEMVDLVDQGIEKRLHFDREVRQHLPETRVGRTATFRGEGVDALFAAFTARVRRAGLLLDGKSKRSDLVSVTTEKVGLLLLEEGKQGTILLQFVTQTFSDKFPGYIHGG